MQRPCKRPGVNHRRPRREDEAETVAVTQVIMITPLAGWKGDTKTIMDFGRG